MDAKSCTTWHSRQGVGTILHNRPKFERRPVTTTTSLDVSDCVSARCGREVADLAKFGEAIKARRLWLGLTQNQAAQKAGVSDTTWGSVEAGNQSSERTTVGIVRALQWPPDAFDRIQRGEDLVDWEINDNKVVDLMASLEESVRRAKESVMKAKTLQLDALEGLRSELTHRDLEAVNIHRYVLDPNVDWFGIIASAPENVQRAILELLQPYIEQRTTDLRLAAAGDADGNRRDEATGQRDTRSRVSGFDPDES